MKSLNIYINESWGRMKQHALKSDIEAWCKGMGIENYTINNESEIDVDGGVYLRRNTFEELPYKFGKVRGNFSVSYCKNLISLKNCPDYVERDFTCMDCSKIDSLEGCPKEVKGNFYCNGCKREFTEEEVKSLCKVKRSIIVRYKSINK